MDAAVSGRRRPEARNRMLRAVGQAPRTPRHGGWLNAKRFAKHRRPTLRVGPAPARRGVSRTIPYAKLRTVPYAKPRTARTQNRVRPVRKTAYGPYAKVRTVLYAKLRTGRTQKCVRPVRKTAYGPYAKLRTDCTQNCVRAVRESAYGPYAHLR
jgi:hypothetical protein